MEVVISLKDTSVAGSENGSGRMAARIRGDELTPAPPAFNTEFEKKTGGALHSASNFIVMLSHNLIKTKNPECNPT